MVPTVNDRSTELRRARWASLVMAAAGVSLVLGSLGGCQTAPKPAPAPDVKAAAPTPAPPPVAPQPAPTPPPEPPMSAAELRQAMDTVRNSLDQGQEEAAVEILQRILRADPNHKLATSYMKQIKEDPQSIYGSDSTAYRVAVGDTLATIASRALKDRDQFYGLARYNDIKVPRLLQVGQTIRVPGKVALAQPSSASPAAAAPPAAVSPAPAPPVAAPSPSVATPSPTPPPAAAQPTQPAPPTSAPTTPQVATVDDKQQQIEQCTREARRAQVRQELCTVIDRWTCVLLIDPGHKTALYERDRAIELKKKLPNAPC